MTEVVHNFNPFEDKKHVVQFIPTDDTRCFSLRIVAILVSCDAADQFGTRPRSSSS